MARRERKRFVKGNEKPFKINRTSRGASVPSGNPKVINPGGSGVINPGGGGGINPGGYNTQHVLDNLPTWLHEFYLENQAMIHDTAMAQNYMGSSDRNLLNMISRSNGRDVERIVQIARRQLPNVVSNIEVSYNQQQTRGWPLGWWILAIIVVLIIRLWSSGGKVPSYEHGGSHNGMCAPGEYCGGGDVNNGYATGGRTSCPPGTHWMPPSNGQPGYCMEGRSHPGGYAKGGRVKKYQQGGHTHDYVTHSSCYCECRMHNDPQVVQPQMLDYCASEQACEYWCSAHCMQYSNGGWEYHYSECNNSYGTTEPAGDHNHPRPVPRPTSNVSMNSISHLDGASYWVQMAAQQTGLSTQQIQQELNELMPQLQEMNRMMNMPGETRWSLPRCRSCGFSSKVGICGAISGGCWSAKKGKITWDKIW